MPSRSRQQHRLCSSSRLWWRIPARFIQVRREPQIRQSRAIGLERFRPYHFRPESDQYAYSCCRRTEPGGWPCLWIWRNRAIACGHVVCSNTFISVRLGRDTDTKPYREMAVGNTFGATALSSYGGFWLSFAIILTPGGFNIREAYVEEQGMEAFYDAFGFFLMVRSPFPPPLNYFSVPPKSCPN